MYCKHWNSYTISAFMLRLQITKLILTYINNMQISQLTICDQKYSRVHSHITCAQIRVQNHKHRHIKIWLQYNISLWDTKNINCFIFYIMFLKLLLSYHKSIKTHSTKGQTNLKTALNCSSLS